MGAVRWSIAVAIGGATMLGCSGKSSESKPISGEPGGKAAIAAPAGPSLGTGASQGDGPILNTPTLPPTNAADQGQGSLAAAAGAADAARAGNAEVPPSEAFESQTRDPAWAGPTEVELTKRIATIGGQLDRTECRHDRCVLALRGSSESLAETLARLESSNGLTGFAQSIYLTAPIEQNGVMVVRAYATFDR
jgi:hypothetical protein